ncbi:MAG: 5-(carboxyamino)imidazole ribonucleotide synthase [Verrucomicrobiae bacterium]|nr:5-(carboxyamino)imidazole ribonucleotide synthase [Verrucomicrobiae bacterium]
MNPVSHPQKPVTTGFRRPRLGIIGGGQLAKMTAQAATQLGCEVVVLERQEDFPAHSLDTHALIGDWDDPQQVARLAAEVDVVTLENEFVSPAALGSVPVLWPKAETLALVRDKLRQKIVFAEAGLPVARFADAPTPDAVRRFGFPAVLKKRFYSYDGKGNATVHSADELPAAWVKLDGDRNPLYVEEYCPFIRELAIIITRGQDGAVVRYPVVETINRNHICNIVKAPLQVPGVADIAERAVIAVGGVGSFGLEFFELPDGRILLNEIAPRVHNTGHYTIEACECSQFENHVRAVFGWPLGSPAMRAPAAAMINLLGVGDGPGTPVGLAEALRVPGAHLHIYGKSRSAPGRKMGHVTALGATLAEALATAQRAADCVRFGRAP